MKRFWISWEQKSSDYRPLQDPPQPESIKAWWKSGEDGNGDYATLCAIVDAESEQRAGEDITKGWDESGNDISGIRFCTERDLGWLPNDRFPITEDWQRERLGIK